MLTLVDIGLQDIEGDRYKLRSGNSLGSSSDLSYQDAQATRLLAEVEFNERLAQYQARHNLEIQALKDQLLETEAQRDSLQREVTFHITSYSMLLTKHP